MLKEGAEKAQEASASRRSAPSTSSATMTKLTRVLTFELPSCLFMDPDDLTPVFA